MRVSSPNVLEPVAELRPKVEEFFEQLPPMLKLTFADVKLAEQGSDFLPHETNLNTAFARGVSMKIPISSAAMTTVTGAELAIALAKCGGLGILPRGEGVDEQVRQAKRVKFHLGRRIDTPITFPPEASLQMIEDACNDPKRKLHFRTFPITQRGPEESKILVGLVTGSTFRFNTDRSCRAREVMVPFSEIVTAPPDITKEQALTLMRGKRVTVLPLVDDRATLFGMYLLTDLEREEGGEGTDEAMYNVDSSGRLVVGAAVSVTPQDIECISTLVPSDGSGPYVDVIVIDTAHGGSAAVPRMVREIKRYWPEMPVVAGNISNPELVKALVDAGADAIKVGNGPGSACTTGVVTGIGCPQVSAIYECARELRRLGCLDIPVIGDGGIRFPADIVKALVAGASSVMIGGLFARAQEAPGASVDGFRDFFGMGSARAMSQFKTSEVRYGQQGSKKKIPEGIEGKVRIVGPLSGIVGELTGGLRSSMGYQGTRTIAELRARGAFYWVTPNGTREAFPAGSEIFASE